MITPSADNPPSQELEEQNRSNVTDIPRIRVANTWLNNPKISLAVTAVGIASLLFGYPLGPVAVIAPFLLMAVALISALAVNEAKFHVDLKAILAAAEPGIPGPLNTEIKDLFARTTSLDQLRMLLIELNQCGFSDRTIHLLPANQLAAVSPVSVQFEPILLNQSDIAFARLTSALEEQLAHAKSNDKNATGSENMNQPLETLKRMWLVKGGWRIVVSITPMLIGAALIFVQAQLGWIAISCTVFLAFTFPLLISGIRTERWFVVPGGLLLLARESGKSKSRFFTSQNAILCVYRFLGTSYGFTVSNSTGIESRIATQREIEFLVRAWTSPHLPPTQQQLEELINP